MTYFSFLLKFLLFPVLFFLVIALIDGRRGKTAQSFMGGRAVWVAIGIHILLAVVYTTPWDNYLVATGVWYYDPKLISGIVLGWVPIEEYLFFVLETILTGLWWLFLIRRLRLTIEFKPGRNVRFVSTAVLAVVWLIAVSVLTSSLKPASYLSLIIVWALPAMMLQLAFGADILWHYRKIVTLAILPVFLYVSAADALAISSGTWTIDPLQSLGITIGTLPIEEAVFFLVTVIIIGFGLTISLACASQARWASWVERARKAYPWDKISPKIS